MLPFPRITCHQSWFGDWLLYACWFWSNDYVHRQEWKDLKSFGNSVIPVLGVSFVSCQSCNLLETHVILHISDNGKDQNVLLKSLIIRCCRFGVLLECMIYLPQEKNSITLPCNWLWVSGFLDCFISSFTWCVKRVWGPLPFVEGIYGLWVCAHGEWMCLEPSNSSDLSQEILTRLMCC